MNKQQINKVLEKARVMCAEAGGRLTEKRAQILTLLLQAKAPLSAYEVADAYNKASDSQMPTMSVYRILDFLQSGQLVHKLNSANKYVACSHIACSHDHQVPQFLICEQCKRVKEIAISHSLVSALTEQVQEAGFKLLGSQLELQCLCEDCANKKG